MFIRAHNVKRQRQALVCFSDLCMISRGSVNRAAAKQASIIAEVHAGLFDGCMMPADMEFCAV